MSLFGIGEVALKIYSRSLRGAIWQWLPTQVCGFLGFWTAIILFVVKAAGVPDVKITE